MNTRTILMHARKRDWAKLTNSQLQIAALKAFPSSPFQLAIREELNRRQTEQLTNPSQAS